jgi:hypothetical protein
VGRRIKVGLWRSSTRLLQGTDLCHQRMRYASLPVQRNEALFDPLTEGQTSSLGHHSELAMLSPECGQLKDDIAVSAVGGLDEAEWGRLLRHLGACSHCDALRAEYTKAVRALETLIPLGGDLPRLSHRIMASIRRANELGPSVAPQDLARPDESARDRRSD